MAYFSPSTQWLCLNIELDTAGLLHDNYNNDSIYSMKWSMNMSDYMKDMNLFQIIRF